MSWSLKFVVTSIPFVLGSSATIKGPMPSADAIFMFMGFFTSPISAEIIPYTLESSVVIIVKSFASTPWPAVTKNLES
ncbi:MAG: hypothetical protein BWY02_02234 [bacterium ADurb.Bin157]|nr:MAG: hypothetical protein BWY02_02234 [bacterium ADurb.Bin157]